MTNRELALSLGISRQMVGRLKARGMPTDSVEAATQWRNDHLDLSNVKTGRIDGNPGTAYKAPEADTPRAQAEMEPLPYVLAKLMPDLWFSELGYLAVVLGEVGIEATPAQVLELQRHLLLAFAVRVNDFLETDGTKFNVPPLLCHEIGSPEHKSLVEKLAGIQQASEIKA